MEKLALESFPLQSKVCDVCLNGCQMFTDDTTVCSYCEESRFKPNTTEPRAAMRQLPLSGQLGIMISRDETRNLLKYPFTREEPDEGVLRDIFDGDVWKRAAISSDDHIAISLFVDGFNPFKRGGRTMTMVVAIDSTFHPSIGKISHNVLALNNVLMIIGTSRRT